MGFKDYVNLSSMGYWSVNERFIVLGLFMWSFFELCVCFLKLFILYWIFCKYIDIFVLLYSLFNVLFIWFDLFILCLFFLVFWCEFNINLIFKVNLVIKISFNESKY